MKTDTIKSEYPAAYRIGCQLAANPQRTVTERLEADALRQEAARNGWTALVTQVAVEMAGR